MIAIPMLDWIGGYKRGGYAPISSPASPPRRRSSPKPWPMPHSPGCRWDRALHRLRPHGKVRESLEAPGYSLKIIPHVDGTPRICEIARYHCGEVVVHGAWEGPAALVLFHHALAPVAALPVLEVLSASHILSDLTLNLGSVVHDYLAPERKKP
jgi:hypothetical protein